jgi:glutamate-1-semialdehyde 2,1-aminomutase
MAGRRNTTAWFPTIVTGFRFAYGGAQEYYGVVPDIAAFGKILAGGYPLGAVTGSEAIMRLFDPALEGTPEHVWQAGTLNGNPVAAVAGLATLAELEKPGQYAKLHRTGNRLKDGLTKLSAKHGMPARVSGEAPVFDIIFTDQDVVDYRATLTADRRRIALFNEECLRRGVVKAVNKIYVSLAHTDADLDETLGVFDEALAAVKRRTA